MATRKKKKKQKAKSKKQIPILGHIGITLLIGILATLFFFYLYLPSVTNHGETITVPNLKGMNLRELDNFLLPRDLRFEISDSSYSSKYPPYTVLYQFPKAKAKVKVNRKIFLSLNQKIPPKTLMPNLIDKTIQNAEIILKSQELLRGKVTTKPDDFRNVLEQNYQGEPIKPNTKIYKGSEIDLVIGDGKGLSEFEMPWVLGLSLEEAKIIIKGNSLKVGIIFNENNKNYTNTFVIKQSPKGGDSVRVASEVNIWMGSLEK